MAAAAAALARSASSAAAIDRGVVRVTASEIMGAEVLPAIFAGFRARNPGIAIELAVTNRNQDLARGDADIAVRMVRPTQSGLVARRIGSTRIRLYAHRDYLDRFGEPRSLADLPHHCFIGFDRDNQTFRSAGALAKSLTREDFGFRCDSDVAQLAALRAGVGIGGCQDAIARRTPDLVPVLPNAFQMTLEVWLVMHRDLKTAPRVRLLFDWLAAGPDGLRQGEEPERAHRCHSRRTEGRPGIQAQRPSELTSLRRPRDLQHEVGEALGGVRERRPTSPPPPPPRASPARRARPAGSRPAARA